MLDIRQWLFEVRSTFFNLKFQTDLSFKCAIGQDFGKVGTPAYLAIKNIKRINTLLEIQIPLAVDVRIEDELFYVQLEDGREIGVPYHWYWRLSQATESERLNWRFISEGTGIHWEDIDEDISIAGILKGSKNPNPPSKLRSDFS